MDKSVKVAIIDNGINELLLAKGLEKCVAVDEKGICVADTKKIDRQQFQHGTNCAMIIEKYCPNCDLISIRILDESGKGGVASFQPALD